MATVETRDRQLDAELSGLAHLDALPDAPSRASRLWCAGWPKLAAAVIGIAAWQIVVWSHWKPSYILPGPLLVFRALWRELAHGDLPRATGVTLQLVVTL